MKKRAREAASPDITPLIDVVFLLLIFFMVSTVFKKDELALLLNLPSTGSGQATKVVKSITVELSKDRLALDGKDVSIEQFATSLQAIKDKKAPVDVRIDKDVVYDRVIKVLDKLKENKMNNLSLITTTLKE